MRFEQENDVLAHELVATKVSLRAKLDEVREITSSTVLQFFYMQFFYSMLLLPFLFSVPFL